MFFSKSLLRRPRDVEASVEAGVRALLAALAVAGAALALSACAVRTYPPSVGGYATIYASDVPVDIDTYPRAPFQGGYAYLVHDQWYYRSGGGWVVLRGEPEELRHYRSRYVAPPAYRGGYDEGRGAYRQQAPPAYGYPPPSVRVR